MADEFISHCRKAPERGSMIINGAVRQLASSISPGIPSAKVTKMLKPGSNFRLPQGSGGRSELPSSGSGQRTEVAITAELKPQVKSVKTSSCP